MARFGDSQVPEQTGMSHADFVHLRTHTAYSLAEGAIKIDQLVRLCVENSMPAVAITDTGNLFGAMEFSLACAKAGVQPIIGCQLTLRDDHDDGSDGGPGKNRDPAGIVALAQNETGYRNLMALVSRSYLDGDRTQKPFVTVADLADMTDGLIALTGGTFGPIGRALLDGQAELARARLDGLRALFPERLYVELTRHGQAEDRRAEPGLLDLAESFDLPLLATNECFFASPDRHAAHDALLCIAEGRYVSESDRRTVSPEHWFKPASAMREVFADLPEALDNSLTVAKRCAFMLEPKAPLLPDARVARDDVPEIETLTALSREGLHLRLADISGEEARKPYFERLEFELKVIGQMGYAGYFLIVAEFIRWAKAQSIPVGPGRGSGAGSVVAWALLITDLDPLRFGLLFERFLNPERVSMPDFDIDFCQDRRDEVIRHVQDHYGADRVAQIITFGKLQARAVVRDVGRVLQMGYNRVDGLSKLVPYNPANPVTLQEAIDAEPRLQEQRAKDREVRRLFDIALQLEGLYRHASTHAAGVVIGDRDLKELVPLYRDPRSDMAVTQFNMKYVELAGLVKFDFLGLKTLTVLARARRMIADRGTDLDIAALPLDDRKTFDMLAKGDTVGVFQMESSGMRDVLRKLRPDRFEDLIAVVALYRPGPMDNIPHYIARKHGQEPIEFLHPSLEEILSETYGIMIYQEQVMRIAQTLSGFSLGSADLLRRAMGKKIKAEMEAQRLSFIDGAVARGVARSTASTIFEQVNKFAGYGFNKSHAAAYALVAYQTAYLKANFPVEFMAASMTLDQGNTDKLALFRQELARLEIALRPPDINRSQVSFSVEYDRNEDGETVGAVRYALAAIKTVGQQAMQTLVEERDRNGPFVDLFDLGKRIGSGIVNKRAFENLVKAGALDELAPNRAQCFQAIDVLLRYGNRTAEERGSGQTNMFGDDTDASNRPALPITEDWPIEDRLKFEYEALGFYFSAHPLDAYGKSLQKLDVRTIAELLAADGAGDLDPATLAGVVQARRERTSKRGRYAFVEMSDQTGVYEVSVFSDLFEAQRDLLEIGEALLVRVSVQRDEDSVRLIARRIARLEERAAGATAGYRIFVDDPGAAPSLRSVLERGGPGRGRIAIVLPIKQGREAEIALREGYKVTPPMRAALRAVPGVVDVHDL